MSHLRTGIRVLATLACLVSFPTAAVAELEGGWTAGFAAGANGPVYAAAFYQGDLVIGGDFTSVGGVAASNVARWDGSSWHAFGSGIDGRVHALVEYQGGLIAGGLFTQAGSANTDNVARWTGSFWTTMGDGVDAIVYSLEVFGGVIATGAFTEADGNPAARIARWNGSTWVGLGTGLNNTGLSLRAVGNDLYAGGFFSSAGGASASGIARWDGSSWHALGDGISEPFPNPFSVEAIAEFDGKIAAAGRFSTAGSVAAENVALWDGSSWESLDDGLIGGTPPIGGFAVAEFRGELVVAGRFATAGGTTASRIASWDGSTWSMLATGLNDDGYALAAEGTMLFAGGNFTQAGPFTSGRIAQWLAPPAAAGAVPDGDTVPGVQLTIRKLVVPAFASIEWGPSCGSDDVDYAVYVGTMGDFTSHVPLVCSTGGSLSHAFAISEDAYYLVVPKSLDFEGAYGFDSDGNERPASTAACQVQDFAACE